MCNVWPGCCPPPWHDVLFIHFCSLFYLTKGEHRNMQMLMCLYQPKISTSGRVMFFPRLQTNPTKFMFTLHWKALENIREARVLDLVICWATVVKAVKHVHLSGTLVHLMWLHPSFFCIGELHFGQGLEFVMSHKLFATRSVSGHSFKSKREYVRKKKGIATVHLWAFLYFSL